MPLDARVVAFDLPTEFVTQLSNGSVSNPQPLPQSGINHGWQFIGFDVVDARTQTSAFHGLELNEPALNDVKEKHSYQFNSHGLIDEWDDALKASKTFDKLIPEHAPFSPCGIWLKDTPCQ